MSVLARLVATALALPALVAASLALATQQPQADSMGIATSQSPPAAHSPAKTRWEPGHTAQGLMCFKSGERTEGMNKICYYQCPSGGAAITIGAIELCPLSITR